MSCSAMESQEKELQKVDQVRRPSTAILELTRTEEESLNTSLVTTTPPERSLLGEGTSESMASVYVGKSKKKSKSEKIKEIVDQVCELVEDRIEATGESNFLFLT